MVNSIGNNYSTNAAVTDNSKAAYAAQRQDAPAAPKEIVNKIESKDLRIKDQIKDMADNPPIDKALVEDIKAKVEQGIYPIDLDLVMDKMFESFRESKT